MQSAKQWIKCQAARAHVPVGRAGGRALAALGRAGGGGNAQRVSGDLHAAGGQVLGACRHIVAAMEEGKKAI